MLSVCVYIEFFVLYKAIDWKFRRHDTFNEAAALEYVFWNIPMKNLQWSNESDFCDMTCINGCRSNN